MNIPTFIIMIIVFGILFLVAVKIYCDRKKNKSTCGLGCAGCAGKDICGKDS